MKNDYFVSRPSILSLDITLLVTKLRKHKGEYMKQVVENIRNDQHLLFTYESRPMTENMKRYSEFYHLPTEDVIYRYGFEQMAHERLFIQSFRPMQVKAHILIASRLL